MEGYAMRATLVLLLATATVGPLAAQSPRIEQHVIVFGEDGKFGGWPANHGIWHWDNEILVGFSVGTHQDLGNRHNINREEPEHHVLARSLDGGLTWNLEFPALKGQLINQGGMRHGITDPALKEKSAVPITERIHFAHPDFAMSARFTDVDGGHSRLYYSCDRGHNWMGPFKVPRFGQPGIMARTDYIVDGPVAATVLFSVSKQNREESRVIATRTTDGGLNWEMLSFVGPEPTGFSIMPSTVRLNANSLLMATRRREGKAKPKHRWIDLWQSTDNGSTWRFLRDAVEDVGEGNPPALIRLRDGRLCLTYGDRKPPFEILAKLSRDRGAHWSEPIVLKANGGGRDIGYTRSVQRPDGKIVTLYYFQPNDTPYRQIIATIWDPGA
jgi:hypothetical protein